MPSAPVFTAPCAKTGVPIFEDVDEYRRALYRAVANYPGHVLPFLRDFPRIASDDTSEDGFKSLARSSTRNQQRPNFVAYIAELGRVEKERAHLKAKRAKAAQGRARTPKPLSQAAVDSSRARLSSTAKRLNRAAAALARLAAELENSGPLSLASSHVLDAVEDCRVVLGVIRRRPRYLFSEDVPSRSRTH
jgi:hypothetical protein